MSITPVTTASDPVADALALRDLTDPAAGEHAVQHVVTALEAALTAAWHVPLHHDAGPRVVTVADNYDRLRYSPDAGITPYQGGREACEMQNAETVLGVLREHNTE
jgi:hypothetical protein